MCSAFYFEADGTNRQLDKPFFRSPSLATLPEQIQRFLREPSLVSFGDRTNDDDLAWMDADSTSDTGVSERARPSEPPRKHRGQLARELSPASEHPSQQSTQLKEKSPDNEKRCRITPKLVSRGTSPIVTRPLHPHETHYILDKHEKNRENIRTSKELRNCDKRSETVTDDTIGISVDLGLPPSPAKEDNLSQMYSHSGKVEREGVEEDMRVVSPPKSPQWNFSGPVGECQEMSPSVAAVVGWVCRLVCPPATIKDL